MNTAFKAFIRNYKKRSVIYSITIGGFAISMAVFFFIVAFIINEKKVDKHIPNVESMYRMVTRGFVKESPLDVAEIAQNTIPAIDQICVYTKEYVMFDYEKVSEKIQLLTVDDRFFNMFPVIAKRGSIWSEGSKNEVLITEEYAEKIFKGDDPIGKTVIIGGKHAKQVVGVINNPTKYSSLQYQVIHPLQNDLFNVCWPGRNGGAYKLNTAFCLSPAMNVDTVRSHLDKALGRYTLNRLKDRDNNFVQAYSEIYFSNAFDEHRHANVQLIKLLTYIAIVILLLAILNYINLSTASNLERFKEVCIRKTNGAHNLEIIRQFLSESFMACIIALVLSIGLIALLSPVFSTILDQDFNAIKQLGDMKMIGMVIITFIFVGLITGIVPALIAASYSPIQLLHHRVKRSGFAVRSIFNSIQFVVTIVLIICLLVINEQIEYAKTKDYGFNKEQLLSIRTEGKAHEQIKSIADELKKYAAIDDVTTSMGIPLHVEFSRSGRMRVENDEIDFMLGELRVDENFIQTYKIPLLLGRNVREEDWNTGLINETCFKELEWKNLDNKRLWGTQIVGVVKDFHSRSLNNKIGNIVLRYENADYNGYDYITVKMNGQAIPETMAHIKSVIKEFDPYVNLDFKFFDERINLLYHKEEKQAKAIRFYAIITILISLMGLIGMVEFASKNKTKEIGIRKVSGAHIWQVILHLIKTFGLGGLAAFIIAVPVAYYVMNKWLENFAYKTEISWWIFALAGIIALGIAFITVGWQSWKAATRNPVEALRYE